MHARGPGLKPKHAQYMSLLHIRSFKTTCTFKPLLFNYVYQNSRSIRTSSQCHDHLIVSYSIIYLTLRLCLQVVKMLITIVTFFGLCWLPLHSFILVMEITNMDRWADSDLQKVLGHLYFVAHWLAMSNSFVNPIIYGFMNDNFRVSYVIIQMQQNLFSTSRSVHPKLHCYVQVLLCRWLLSL